MTTLLPDPFTLNAEAVLRAASISQEKETAMTTTIHVTGTTLASGNVVWSLPDGRVAVEEEGRIRIGWPVDMTQKAPARRGIASSLPGLRIALAWWPCRRWPSGRRAIRTGAGHAPEREL